MEDKIQWKWMASKHFIVKRCYNFLINGGILSYYLFKNAINSLLMEVFCLTMARLIVWKLPIPEKKMKVFN